MYIFYKILIIVTQTVYLNKIKSTMHSYLFINAHIIPKRFIIILYAHVFFDFSLEDETLLPCLR